MSGRVIYINGRFLTQTITGVQRYAIEILKGIDKVIDENPAYLKGIELIILMPNQLPNSTITFRHIKQRKVGKLKGHLWEQFELPYFSRGCGLINLCNLSPLVKRSQIITIHDVAVYTRHNNQSILFKYWYKVNYNIFKGRFKKVLTVSEFSLDEIVRYKIFPREKITVTQEGKEHILKVKEDYSVFDKHSLNPKEYFLAVSSLNPTKNFKGIVNALKLLDENVTVVIAGGSNSKVFNEEDIVFPGNVKRVGYITDSELKALYLEAKGFIYPSLYEGFGLPPLEAMSLGCPVIVSNAASLPEVCKDAAVYCNPYDPKDIARTIKLLNEDNHLRSELSRKGSLRSESYSWERAAENILEVLKEIYS